MEIGLETIGNATLIIYEKEKPLLASDPWFEDDPAYFGSWRLSHQFPQKQREAVENAKFIFISHGHPDHLNLLSLKSCKKSTILLAQHYGSRIEKDLRKTGFNVITLPSRKWINIGGKTRILLFNNELQDSALLVELTDNIGEKILILNLNDSAGIGFEKEAASISRKYKNTIYLRLHCWGDADMINIFDRNGIRIEPVAAKKFPVGRDIKAGMDKYNANIAIPFSNLHQYQRRDSFWANQYVTPIEALHEGFSSTNGKILLPPFQKINFKNGSFTYENLNPRRIEILQPIHESYFGDDWSDLLNKRQIKECLDYFYSISMLFVNYKSIILNVGGSHHEMLKEARGKAKIIFSVPKTSLLRAIRQEIFDDLLIGNFMKTQIINAKSLYNPDFTKTVAKYSDNGGVNQPNQLKKYFNYYNHHRSKRDRLNLISYEINNHLKYFLGGYIVNKLKYLIRR